MRQSFYAALFFAVLVTLGLVSRAIHTLSHLVSVGNTVSMKEGGKINSVDNYKYMT